MPSGWIYRFNFDVIQCSTFLFWRSTTRMSLKDEPSNHLLTSWTLMGFRGTSLRRSCPTVGAKESSSIWWIGFDTMMRLGNRNISWRTKLDKTWIHWRGIKKWTHIDFHIKNPCNRADLVRITTHDHTENFLLSFPLIYFIFWAEGGVTDTPFLYHIVQLLKSCQIHPRKSYSTLRTHLFCTLLWSVRFSSFGILLELALIDSLVFDQIEEDRYTYAY